MSPLRRLDAIKNSAETVNSIHPQSSYLLPLRGLFPDTNTSLYPAVLRGPPKILLAGQLSHGLQADPYVFEGVSRVVLLGDVPMYPGRFGSSQ
jgi:hypothetical protein